MNRKLLTTAVCTALVSAVAPAYAQQANAASNEDSITKIEAVTVTGSRISNPNVVSPAPVSVLTAEDIKATGAVNIGDLLTTMPQLATTFTMGNSGRFIGTAGVAMQDLRNLGTARTLVLVNGRRMVGASAGTSAVDTNLIPADWVERVEVITGGASAVYGADAVSGVVNFILKKKYEGANAHVQIGDSQHGGFKERLFSFTAGTNFADDRGNVAISVEHSQQDPLWFPDRFGRQNYATVLTPGGAYDGLLLPNSRNYIYTTGGAFSTAFDSRGNPDPRVPSQRYVFNPDGSVRKQRFDGIYDNRNNCQDCEGLTNNETQLQPDYKRTTVSSVASFDLSQDHRLYFEGMYSKVASKSYGSAAFAGANNYHIIEKDNAYIRPDLAALTADMDYIRITRDDLDSGLRGEDTERQTARLVFGIEGAAFGSESGWLYDASVNYGRTQERRRNLNNRIMERFYAGLDAVVDPSSGQIVCRSKIDPTHVNEAYYNNTGTPDGIISPEVAASCIPFSIFGDGAINPAAREWFNATTISKARLTQFVAGGSLTNNNLFDLPAGPISFGAGVEYRRETSETNNDPLDISGQTFLNAIPSARGSYNVREVWTEVAVPLLHDIPLIKSLTVGAAARYSKYDTIGSTRAWRYNLDWAINDSLRIRGNMSAAVRAPNIDELFGGQSQNFGIVDDPCDPTEIPNGKDPAVRARNCAALGLPADFIDRIGSSNEGLQGSNPDLDPETGRSWTAGFVFTPTFLEGFGFNVDYWKIRIENAISAPSFQETADHCVDSPSGIDNIYCRNAQRRADGQLEFLTSINQNISLIETDGVDIAAYYTHDLWGGRMRWDLNATKVLSYDDYPFQEDPEDNIDRLKTLGYPEWKATLRAGYSRDNWDVNWSTRFASGGLRVSNESYASNPKQTNVSWAGSGVFHDMRGSYTFKDTGLQIYGGVTNVFDSDPPVNLFGTGFGSGLYDQIGRAYYVGLNYKFN
ncbi:MULTISPECIES: TonB-dependent receptor domain-containing protein [Lysobacter]|uniref:TonB-dependent receptor domain-containing protein n=1 Tax=Lysobacter TaxID=68 RepID=UPI001F175B46|nr:MULTISPECIES: TonB-dependent receptor [Lysobacter]UJB19373.1 TonB-dependent receptor [Lysobacter capsici]UJQ26902.1 TonB-dependent receptor [Lysobacter gummosus]